MPNRIKHDTERWLRSNAELYRRKGNQQMARNFELCAEDFTALRLRAEQAEARCTRLEEALRFILDECDWEETAYKSGGDSRIGHAARKALEDK